ncbi:molybdopterin-guanine dinucleotide biosynthesis protein MobC (plasmid) [Pectobacterium parmentieri]|uniref:molybdopterin-guanine dinucleotide biosynthesis protein MobC n=1 Tax=Pectobacterium parmentieri TaxID=1905730 RepID=UPI000F8E1150|nr:molybdopterin-guanine dinucleotide biosynthesis protein MobC [Pectobacterium parmentieri]AZS59269.1 molybdopterin-guanine dinucleotide biosynthesis protein MobC [Pectobacterium parmentieri]
MSDKKWYSEEDISLAKDSLSELPDLSKKRLTKTDVLEQLRDQIIELSEKKGYSIEDIRDALSTAGIPTSVKAIREILNSKKKPTNRVSRTRKNAQSENTPDPMNKTS